MIMFHVNLPGCKMDFEGFLLASQVFNCHCHLHPETLGCPNFNSKSFGMAPKFSKMRRLFLGEVDEAEAPRVVSGDNNPMATLSFWGHETIQVGELVQP